MNNDSQTLYERLFILNECLNQINSTLRCGSATRHTQTNPANRHGSSFWWVQWSCEIVSPSLTWTSSWWNWWTRSIPSRTLLTWWADPLWQLTFECQKMPKTWHFFQKNCQNCIEKKMPKIVFQKNCQKIQFLALFLKKLSSFWQLFDIQMAILRRVRWWVKRKLNYYFFKKIIIKESSASIYTISLFIVAISTHCWHNCHVHLYRNPRFPYAPKLCSNEIKISLFVYIFRKDLRFGQIYLSWEYYLT